MEPVVLQLSQFTIEPEVQARIETDESYVAELAMNIEEGAVPPPIVIFYDGVSYRPADGIHRILAYQKAGRTEIAAQVYAGGKREAQLYAVGANATHGKRRTNADKRKAVATLLMDEEWGKWSDRHIAEVCRVSQPLVSDLRKELTESGFQFPPTRKCSDGREMDVSLIGSSRSSSIQVTEEAPRDDNPGETTQVVETASSGDNQIEPVEPGSSQSEASSEGETLPVVEEATPTEGVGDPTENPENLSAEVDEDIPTLKGKIVELEALLQEKDLRIQELESEVKELEEENAYFRKELQGLDEMDQLETKTHGVGRKPLGRPCVTVP